MIDKTTAAYASFRSNAILMYLLPFNVYDDDAYLVYAHAHVPFSCGGADEHAPLNIFLMFMGMVPIIMPMFMVMIHFKVNMAMAMIFTYHIIRGNNHDDHCCCKGYRQRFLQEYPGCQNTNKWRYGIKCTCSGCPQLSLSPNVEIDA